ncbi:MAG TPA: spore-associated protein A [Streptosporangiaceae bacterium]|nr:spore-associated protein A [Streptosporangiaceae bacterium]
MRSPMRAALAGLLGAAMTGGSLVATTTAASAASYNGACGGGYGVVNQRTISGKGAVYLTYNSGNGYNCVVTIRDNPGTAVPMFAGIARQSDPAWADVDEGDYTTYAGPVYRYAKGSCVTWGGAISGSYAGGVNTNCG